MWRTTGSPSIAWFDKEDLEFKLNDPEDVFADVEWDVHTYDLMEWPANTGLIVKAKVVVPTEERVVIKTVLR